MPNASALLSVASIAAPQGRAVRAPAPAFSYDDAVAALERQSARSLDIHGGAPATAVTAGRAASAAESAPAPQSATAQSDKADPASPRAAQPAGAPAPATPAQAAPPTAPVTAGAATINIPAPSSAPASLQPSATSATGAREAAARIRTDAARAPAIVRTPPSAAAQFAEILAQRLENASQFELRLDPPALGSVDGRLTLSDDGQAVLALSFDNQSAFDLFRRDEGALRSALADAGFDLAGRNLQFSFRESARTAAPDGAAAPEFSFVTPAPLHRGAIDIRA